MGGYGLLPRKKGGEAMSDFETLYLMIVLGLLIIEILKFDNNKNNRS